MLVVPSIFAGTVLLLHNGVTHASAPLEDDLPEGQSWHPLAESATVENLPGAHCLQGVPVGEVKGALPRSKAGWEPFSHPVQAERFVGAVYAPAPAPLQQMADLGAV